MSSHREAPEISKDPVADSTDVYAFRSPDRPNTVTLIANYLPFQAPDGGPNFYPFGDDVLYEIHIDNDGDGRADITYQFRFHTDVRNPDSFLYNTGPIRSLQSRSWNSRQFYSVTRLDGYGQSTLLATNLACPPDNIGPRSTPNYAALAQAAVHTLRGGIKVFAGQRADGFYVDLGSIFDLLTLRPFQNLHVIPSPAMPGVNGLNNTNVKTIAIQVPITSVRRHSQKPIDASSAAAVIGVWTSASRQQIRLHDHKSSSYDAKAGPFVQVSRLGNPLVNEVIIPLGQKDEWNRSQPSDDKRFEDRVLHPEVARLLPVLYPKTFPNLAAFGNGDRNDLKAILLTGIPSGVIPGFQNFTGTLDADMLRLNTEIAPASQPNNLGLLGGDLAGFPNGRRVADDVVTIELRAIAGLTLPLVDKSFTPDAAAGLITDGLTPANINSKFLDTFPYLGVPYDGYSTPS